MEQILCHRQTQSLSLQLQRSVELLQCSAQELETFVSSEVEKNPFLSFEESTPQRIRITSSKDDDEDTSFDSQSPLSFYDHFESQLVFALQNQEEKHFKKSFHLAFQLLKNLNENGFLILDEDAFLKQQKIPREEFLEMIKLLQTFTPVGIFSRNLRECFEIQLKDLGLYDACFEKILNLSTTCGSVFDFLKKSKMPQEKFASCVETLKKLSHSPLRDFSLTVQSTLADVIVFFNPKENEWDCRLNEACVPKIVLESSYYQDLYAKDLKNKDKDYVRERMQNARWLVSALHKRYETLQKVCKAIIAFQGHFFTSQEGVLLPLNLREIAGRVSMHESTVSRAIRQKYIETPKGVFPIRHFFSAGVNPLLFSWSDEKVSSNRIQVILKELIQEEPQNAPFSDQRLVTLLQERGIIVARRTIAKYRGICNIPIASKRKGFSRVYR